MFEGTHIANVDHLLGLIIANALKTREAIKQADEKMFEQWYESLLDSVEGIEEELKDMSSSPEA